MVNVRWHALSETRQRTRSRRDRVAHGENTHGNSYRAKSGQVHHELLRDSGGRLRKAAAEASQVGREATRTGRSGPGRNRMQSSNCNGVYREDGECGEDWQ